MSVSRATGTRTGISLRQILPQAKFLNADDVTVQSCAGRLGECQSQDLFVALVDAEHDGHEDAELALGKGASAVLTERLLPIASPQCIVSDSRVAYGQICHALAGDPSRRLATVGISGTDGKTTTAHLVQSILEADGVESGLHSSLHHANGGLPNTDPANPPALAEQVASMVIGGKRAAVVETSSVSLARRAFSGMQLDVAVLTNLRGGEFEYHNSLANYHQAELRLLDYLKPQGAARHYGEDPGKRFV